jgi:uncharacterized protein HemX
MEQPNAGVGPRPEAKPPSGLLSVSVAANAVLAVVAIGLGIWGWGLHQQTKRLDQRVAEADQKVLAANEERDEAYETSRNLQNSLINAKGMMKGLSDPFRQQPQAGDDDSTPP